MRQEEFEQQYRPVWTQFAELVNQYENRSSRKLLNTEQLKSLPSLYRRLCHALAIAKERQYSPHLIEHLDTLVLKGHQIIYYRRMHLPQRMLRFVVHGFPALVQQYKWFFWSAMVIFYGPALVMFVLTLINPELIYSMVSAGQVANIEAMYDPENRVLGRERESDTDFYMFGYYIQNNIGIGFRTFASGILFTLGSLFFLIFNGLYFGSISAHIVNVKYNVTFFPFVIGHGSFELTAIAICGMAGMMLGWSLIAPGNYTRLDALKLAAKQAVRIMYGATLFLLIAAFVEAFWSSSTNLTNATKYWVGGALWLFVYVYLLWPRRREWAE